MATDADDQATAADDVLAATVMVPMLPCGDIDELADFWTALGLVMTYRQQRPNPYVAFARGGLVCTTTGCRSGTRSRVTRPAGSW